MQKVKISRWKATMALVLGLLLLPLLCAPGVAADDGPSGTGAAAAKPAAQPASADADASPAAALPAAQPAAPQPAPPAKSGSDPHIKPGSDYPHWEAFLGYSLLNARFGPGIDSKNANGGSGDIAYNFNHWFGLAADLGGYDWGDITVPGGMGPEVIKGLHAISYLFGPRLNYRFGDKDQHTLFGQVLIGGAHSDFSLAGTNPTKNAFTMAAGGGLDIGLTKHIAWRAAQVEYVLTDFDYNNGYKPQNNFRLSSGVLFRWGARPISVNKPPTASCSADSSSIVQGSGGSVPVRANASDPDGDSLTYSWSASGGRVEGSGPTARWSPGDAAPGSYTITARVDDGHGGTASCAANITVEPRPSRPPTVACSVDKNSVLPGEVVNVTASGSSPEGFPLAYEWRASGGRVSGSGSTVQLDTSGLAPGNYSVTARATDGHGGAADCVASVRVNAPPAKPQPVKLGECTFKPGSTRVDNKCSRLLDDAVLRLQNDPKSSLVLIGYEDPVKEKKGKVGETRAKNAHKYVTKGKGKGTARVDSSRVTTRSEKGVPGADTANRRVEVFWVPEGAVF
jgi:hypothetical protein